jgi:hypothetical protein
LADTLLLVRIALFAGIVPLLTRLPIRRLEALVDTVHPSREIDVARAERIIQHTEFVCRAGRRLISRLCLTRGLTLFYFLRRAGVNASLVFGAGSVQDKFAGHCWLVLNGKPYLEKTDPRPLFIPFYSFNGSSAESAESAQTGEACG